MEPTDKPEMVEESMPEEKAEYSDYELKDMAECLQKAAEIQGDPGLMKLLKPLIDKKVRAIRSLADLRAVAQEKANDAENTSEDASEEPESED